MVGGGSEKFSLEYFFRFADQNFKFESITLWFRNISILIGPILFTVFLLFQKQDKILKNFYFFVFVLFFIHIFFCKNI